MPKIPEKLKRGHPTEAPNADGVG